MGYEFMCDNCNHTISFQPYEMPNYERNCEDCGQGGCEECITDGRCDDCQKAQDQADIDAEREAEDASTEED